MEELIFNLLKSAGFTIVDIIVTVSLAYCYLSLNRLYKKSLNELDEMELQIIILKEKAKTLEDTAKYLIERVDKIDEHCK